MAGQTWNAESAPYVSPRTGASGDAWADDAAAQGGKGTQRLAEVGEVLPPPDVARALGIASTELAIVRRRVMHLDGRPVELTDSYYPASIARGTRLAEARKIPGGAVAALAQLGHVAAEVIETPTPAIPTAEERAALDLAEGEPVLVLMRTTLNADHEPIEVSVMTMPRGARLTYRIKVI